MQKAVLKVGGGIRQAIMILNFFVCYSQGWGVLKVCNKFLVDRLSSVIFVAGKFGGGSTSLLFLKLN